MLSRGLNLVVAIIAAFTSLGYLAGSPRLQ
jgi:hypothetical protein